MISLSADEIHARAEAFRRKLEGLDAEVIPGLSVIGGGSTPNQALPTFLIMVRYKDLCGPRRLCAGGSPVVARIEDDRLVGRSANGIRAGRGGAAGSDLYALLIAPFGRVDANLVAFVNERRHLHDQAGFHFRRFVDVRYGGALQPRFGLDDFHFDGRGQFDTHRLAFVEFDLHLDVGDQIIDCIAEQFLRSGAPARTSRYS